MSVGKSYLIQCEAVGSRPKAAITWWIDGKLVSETRTFFIFCTISNQIAYSERFIVFVEKYTYSYYILCYSFKTDEKDGLKPSLW